MAVDEYDNRNHDSIRPGPPPTASSSINGSPRGATALELKPSSHVYRLSMAQLRSLFAEKLGVPSASVDITGFDKMQQDIQAFNGLQVTIHNP